MRAASESNFYCDINCPEHICSTTSFSEVCCLKQAYPHLWLHSAVNAHLTHNQGKTIQTNGVTIYLLERKRQRPNASKNSAGGEEEIIAALWSTKKNRACAKCSSKLSNKACDIMLENHNCTLYILVCIKNMNIVIAGRQWFCDS